MTQVPTVIVALGGLLFLMALLGGGITLKEISLPTISPGLRIILIPISLVMMALGIWLSLGSPLPGGGQPASQGVAPTMAGAAPIQPAQVEPTRTSAAASIPYQSSGPLIYEEDFEDGFAVGWDTQWEPEMVILELGDGNHVLRTENSQQILTLPDGVLDYAIEARIMLHTGSGGAAGLGVRWMGGEPGQQPWYSAYIDFAGGWLNLVENDTTADEVQPPAGLSVHSQVPFRQGTWYTLAIEARGSVISLYLNRELVGYDEDDTLRSNRAGLSSWDGGLGPHEFYFDDIRVWSLQ